MQLLDCRLKLHGDLLRLTNQEVAALLHNEWPRRIRPELGFFGTFVRLW